MPRVVPAVAMAALLATGISFRGNAVGRFETKLSKDQQILQAVSRLTFGARPGDVEEVRRVGVEKWIQLQLHPDQIPENPVLDARLKPLATLTMDAAQIIKEYQPAQLFRATQVMSINQLLSQEKLRAVMNGTAEQRQTALKALDPEKLKQVLVMMPPQNLEGLPEFEEQAKMARQAQQQEQQKEARQLRPPLNDLLTPDQIQVALHGTLEERQALFNSLDDPAKRRQVAGAMNPRDLADMPEMRREGMVSRQPQQVLLSDLREGKLYRAIYSNRQLEEVLADFWFNHFNVYEAKNVQVANNSYRSVLAGYERDAIRPHVLGHFKDLLLAVARHPAMLYYLDNWESVSPKALDALKVGPFASGTNPFNELFLVGRQAHGLNENFGRELMELHTLGVDGGYTQDDVIAVARCFTGWTIHDPSAKPEFQFASFMHDPAEKTVLGHKIPAGGGEQDGLQVIDILAHHPSTAKFISKKLARRFVADDPPEALVDRMAATFTKTDGDLRAVLETMFTSREFFSEGAWQAKVKSPLEMVVSAVRALPGETLDSFTLAQKVTDLGEPLYGKEPPTGFPDSSETWLSTSGVLARINFAVALAAGQIPGVKVDASRFEGQDAPAMTRAVLSAVLNKDASPQTLAAIADGLQGKEATPALVVGLAISSPEFQRR
jgi:uncharacterized protein (DUF1800 family)